MVVELTLWMLASQFEYYSSYFRYFGTTLPLQPPFHGSLLSMLPLAEPMRTRLNLMDCDLNDTLRPRMEAHEFV